ncbi:glycine cleavage system aminomethyltransferase GcvT [Schlesneria sp.]|uniref:glycine cleavage system aminomethyltransferase GcvT n=1 Tax=Schlesneria sp. TaxID=2762018 RepID=UPI002EDE9F93
MPLHRTPLFDWHSSHRGRMVEFGGWEMPVQYSSIAEEHHTVRKAVGLFDISHMGRLRFDGPDAQRLLDHLLTCRVDNLVDGQIRYGLVCNDAGQILDDVLVNRINPTSFGLVVNASNRLKIVDWINQRKADLCKSGKSLDLSFRDETQDTGMIAIQGPRSLELVQKVLNTDVSAMRYYFGQFSAFDGAPIFVSRTGYTGEDGFEVIVPANLTVKLWETFIKAGESAELKPCGLGCRDTLRLEAAMPLYGHELSESINPLTAGLKSSVKLDKSEFVGRDALVKIADQENRPVRVGIKLSSKRIAREHSEIFAADARVGEVTSGTFSPTLEQSIAMAYVAKPHSAIGTSITVDIRGKREAAEIVPLPFYKRAK